MKSVSLGFVLALCAGSGMGLLGCGDDEAEAPPDARPAVVDAALPDAAVPDAAPPCDPGDVKLAIEPSADDYETIQNALIAASPGQAIYFCPGTYHLTRGLSLDVENVTLRGAGADRTVLSFDGQTEGAQGLYVTADGFVMEDMAVEDTAGDAVKIEGATGVTIRGVRVEWTGEVSEENGAYGLY
ncbi:MAG TPA: glycosyl hydrolase family 28-related protein, partial [Kofleriaceae bacterium]|nr:glycosyl hydrolase family 28-related protein [Kofleriaceae bacterium]